MCCFSLYLLNICVSDKENTVCKVKEIINNHFNSNLKDRQNQLELIQQRITQVRKTLHLLRYVLVTSYYNNKNCLINTEESNSENHFISAQSRIHPALKKLLGTNFDMCANIAAETRRKRHYKSSKLPEEGLAQEPQQNISPQSNNITDTIEIESKHENAIEATHVPTNSEQEICDSIRNRKKIKRRIVVGNISKWMPSENQEDNSTHKWMIYVRGTKDSPKVSHFISKVVFHLHPSYVPNDVIEVT